MWTSLKVFGKSLRFLLRIQSLHKYHSHDVIYYNSNASLNNPTRPKPCRTSREEDPDKNSQDRRERQAGTLPKSSGFGEGRPGSCF